MLQGRKSALEGLIHQRKSAVVEVKQETGSLQTTLKDVRQFRSQQQRAAVLRIKEEEKSISTRKRNEKAKKVRKQNQKKLQRLEKLKRLDAYRLRVLGDMELELIKRLRDSQVQQEHELHKLKTTLETTPTVYEVYKSKVKGHRKTVSLMSPLSASVSPAAGSTGVALRY